MNSDTYMDDYEFAEDIDNTLKLHLQSSKEDKNNTMNEGMFFDLFIKESQVCAKFNFIPNIDPEIKRYIKSLYSVGWNNVETGYYGKKYFKKNEIFP